MHVAYDLRIAADHFTGVGRHARCLLEMPGPERCTVLRNPGLRMTRVDLAAVRRHPRVERFEHGFGAISPAVRWRETAPGGAIEAAA